MALFVGHLSSETRAGDLEDLFQKYGNITRCDVKMGYAFVEFDDSKDAEDAIKGLDGTKLHGQSIVVEWARGKKREPGSGPGRSERGSGCFVCGESGHFARECPKGGGGGGGGGRFRGGRGGGRGGFRGGRGRGGGGGYRDRDRDRSSPPPRRNSSRSPSPNNDRSPRND